MVLVNGCSGIGTGSSTDVPCFSPLQIISCLQQKCRGESIDDFHFVPYYRGFKGTITAMDEMRTKYSIQGVFHRVNDDTICVTELPIGYWTEDFKQLVESLKYPLQTKEKGKETKEKGKELKTEIRPAIIKDFTENCTETNIHFTITFHKSVKGLEDRDIIKWLKLTTTVSTTNMHLFDETCRLHKYASVTDIINSYFDERLAMYEKRRTYLMRQIEVDLRVLVNKTRFIQEILIGTIDMRNKSDETICEELRAKEYTNADNETGFQCLTRMPMHTVSSNNVLRLKTEQANKEAELARICASTPISMWLHDLRVLETALRTEAKAEELKTQGDDSKAKASAKVKAKATKATK